MNRRLIRPDLGEMSAKLGPRPRKRQPPPEETHAEINYYLRQMSAKTPMVVVLDNGEQLRGHIEWYDRSCLKVHRNGDPNLLNRPEIAARIRALLLAGVRAAVLWHQCGGRRLQLLLQARRTVNTARALLDAIYREGRA